MTLHELAKRYGTDKFEHGYIDFYLETLPAEPKKLLEIGCLYGSSIKMWKDHFPNTEIHSLDLFEEHPIPFEIENVKFWKGNQCDWRLLNELRNENFDIIVDDGSHNARDQMMTFYGLFNGGHYYIEDTHCNREEFYSQGLPMCATAFETFIFLHGGRNMKVNYGNNIILIQCS